MRALALSPSGHLYFELAREADEPSVVDAVEAAVADRISHAFAQGQGQGLFHLGAVEVDGSLPAALAHFRDLARDFVTVLRAQPDLEELRDAIDLKPRGELLADLAASAPPMLGAEYVTAEVMGRLWADTQAFFQRDIRAYRGTVAEYLHAKNAIWNLVGRIFFHLAENKGSSDDTPFAFLATYTTHVSAHAKPQHRPLGKALEESARNHDTRALLALLGPVQRASEQSGLVRAMVESGDIYHPLAWTPGEAHAFLKEVPALEASGVVVRVPNWWNARKPPRPQVRVTVGTKAPSVLGRDALLDFAVDASLDGEHLTTAEVREILKGADGLRLVRGRWVEIDKEKLSAVLDHWKTAEKAATRDGLSFLEGMRLLAGTRDAEAVADPADPAQDARAEWGRVEAGPWFNGVLEGLRSPEGLRAVDPGADLHAELRPYQQVGLKWLFWLDALGLGGCLADDMGLGKTIQVLALLLLLKKKNEAARAPNLLVVPASLIGNWVSEAARFAPGLEVLVAHPSALAAGELSAMPEARVDRADVVLTTYGTVGRVAWMAQRTWGLIVLDEAQAIKNPGAKQTRAVKALRARTRLALTGTPVENRLGDLWSLFDFLSPGLLGTAKEFGRVTKALAKRSHNGYGPLRALLRPYILRRLKTDQRILKDLPEKTELRAFCHLTKAQAALYTEAVRALTEKLAAAEGIERRGAILSALMRFKQICNHPSQWLGDGAYDAGSSGKFRRLREICEPLAERQEKVLIFTQFREMTAPLARFLETVFGRPGLVLDGSTPVKERKKLVDAFQSDRGPPFFVLSIKAGGTGLNLTAASHVIHFDRWWNPAVENQATDRVHRIGQRRNVFVHKLVCRGTVEERIDALIASKQSLSDEILDGGAEVSLTEMSNDALLRMVSLDIGSALQESE